MTDRVHVNARTDIGCVRELNEDSFLASDPVFVVADGVGGHARGEVASRTAVECLARHLPAGSALDPERVIEAIEAANTEVRALSNSDVVGTSTAGTTLSGVVRVTQPSQQGDRWMVINVGDSRVYSWDGNRVEQVTTDHSVVQELVEAGLITPDEALHHPDRNIITRALGSGDRVDVDAVFIPDSEVVAFLICTDGLTRELSDPRISEILRGNPDDPADALVDAAVAAGGHDNVTVLFIPTVTAL